MLRYVCICAENAGVCSAVEFRGFESPPLRQNRILTKPVLKNPLSLTSETYPKICVEYDRPRSKVRYLSVMMMLGGKRGFGVFAFGTDF